MVPVRYKLHFYIRVIRNSVFKVLSAIWLSVCRKNRSRISIGGKNRYKVRPKS
jgi:hypothetical protein